MGTETITTGVQQVQELRKENGSRQKLNVNLTDTAVPTSARAQWLQTGDTRSAPDDVANNWHVEAESPLPQSSSQLKPPEVRQGSRR